MKDLNELGRELRKEYPSSMLDNFSQNHQDYAKAIFSERLQKNLTQQELAESLGVDKRLIHRIEAGDSSLQIEIFENTLRLVSEI
ncbi:multiprotein-bridging factor 1 family protein [Alkalihalobacillus sp. NPDC078783]